MHAADAGAVLDAMHFDDFLEQPKTDDGSREVRLPRTSVLLSGGNVRAAYGEPNKRINHIAERGPVVAR